MPAATGRVAQASGPLYEITPTHCSLSLSHCSSTDWAPGSVCHSNDSAHPNHLSGYRRQLYDAGFSFSKDPDRSLIVYADGSCLDNGKHWAEAGIGLHWGEFDDAWDERTSEPLPGSNQTNNRAELYVSHSLSLH